MPDSFIGDFGNSFGQSFTGSFSSGQFSGSKSRRKRSRNQAAVKDPDPSFLRTLGEGALGVAGAVGNVLDVPGSMVRDLAGGHNPFDQLLTPFSDKNRISGRDLARQYGLAGKKDTWGNFAGGLATEIATDPLTLLGVGFLGKTAKGASLAKTGATTAKNLGGGIRAGERALVAGKVPFGPRWALGTGEKAAKVGDKLDKAYGAVRYSAPGRMAASLWDAPSGGTSTKSGQIASAIAFNDAAKSARADRAMILRISKKLKDAGITDPDKLRRAAEGFGGNVPADVLGEIHTVFKKQRRANKALGRGHQKLKDNYALFFPRYERISPDKKSIGRGIKQFAGAGPQDVGRKEMLKDWKGGTDRLKEFIQDPGIRQIIDESDSLRKSLTSENQIQALKQETLSKLEGYIRQNWGDEFDQMYRLPDGTTPQVPAGGNPLDSLKAALVGMKKTGKTKDSAKAVKQIKQQMKDMQAAAQKVPDLANYLYDLPRKAQMEGVFGNHPLDDMQVYLRHNAEKRANIKAMHSMLDPLVQIPKTANVASPTIAELKQWKKFKTKGLRLRAGDAGKTVYRAIRELGLDPAVAAGTFLKRTGRSVTPGTIRQTLESVIPHAEADDLLKIFDRHTVPQAEGKMRAFARSYLNMFKAGVLTHPARYVRDLMSGTMNSLFHGIVSPKDPFLADAIYRGQTIKGIAKHYEKNPEFRQWISDAGEEFNDKSVTNAVRYLFGVDGPGDAFSHTDMAGRAAAGPKASLDEMLSVVPGVDKSTVAGNISDVFKTAIGRSKDTTWNPLDIQGVADRTSTKFAPVAAGNKVSKYTDTINRLAPYLHLTRKGYSSKAAMDLINSVQVNYDPKTFTQFERMLKNWIPFYSYTSRMTKHVGKELASNPGGGLANVIRAERLATDKSGTTPDHVSQSAAIPLGTLLDGSKRYIGSLGLMSDDALQFMQPSLSNFGMEAMSRLNPLAQKAIEGTTGQSLYFKGPDGTRPINELDPTIGRILANVTGAKDAVRYPGDNIVESLVGLSPLSRVATTARQLTDTRKGPGVKALNTLTGLRITDVSPAAQERTIKRKIEQKAKELGAKTFSSIYFPKELSNDAQSAERIAEYKSVLKSLDSMAKRRKKREDK